MSKHSIPPLNLFMMCSAINPDAFRSLPDGFHFRYCRKNELESWKLLCLEDPRYIDFLTDYYQKVYAHREDEFFRRCLFACNENDTPIGTCFLWNAYGKINTLHWFRVLPEYEGKGIGRALLTRVLRPLAQQDLPVFIHTHPSSFRAIKLYTDFGFRLLSCPDKIGYRSNDYAQSLPYLRESMPEKVYAGLPDALPAPESLLDAALLTEYEQF